MNTERDIDIYEFSWWGALIGHIVGIAVVLALVYLRYILQQVVDSRNAWRLDLLLLPALMYGLFLFPDLIRLRTVPKQILFKENSVVIVPPCGEILSLSYDQIHRFVIPQAPRWSELTKWISTHFRARIYFRGHSKMITFNSDHLVNLAEVLAIIRSKGLGNIIEKP
jgi:hypothetical protein